MKCIFKSKPTILFHFKIHKIKNNNQTFQIRCTEISLLGACDKQPLYTVTNKIPHGRVVTIFYNFLITVTIFSLFGPALAKNSSLESVIS